MISFEKQVYERMRAEGLNDRVAVVNSVQETSLAISALVADHGISGVAATTCALLNSLTQLTSARYVCSLHCLSYLNVFISLITSLIFLPVIVTWSFFNLMGLLNDFASWVFCFCRFICISAVFLILFAYIFWQCFIFCRF